MKKQMLNKKESGGITLIALVITIIVLLILAGVSIAMLTGENGILTQAENAKNDTTKAEAKERIELEVLGSYGTDGEINIAELKTNIAQNVPGAIVEGEELPLTVTLNGYIFTIESNGIVVTPPAGTEITTAESYVGYYADVDADGNVDGIIYADLAVGGEGIWNNDDWSEYSYDPVTEGLKSYVVSEEETTGFGTWSKPVVTAVAGSGTVDRFYVMKLEDLNLGTLYCWYDDAYGKLDDTIATDFNDFGEGKAKTVKMINAWNNKTYGAQDDGSTYDDMWGVVQPEGVNDDGVVTEEEITWFVPSKAEWAAFGDMTFSKIGVTTSTYSNYGLSASYWSSAQYSTGSAYDAFFNYGYVDGINVDNDTFVRLSATF